MAETTPCIRVLKNPVVGNYIIVYIRYLSQASNDG